MASKMTKPDEPSALIRFSGFFIFLFFSIGAFVWFGWTSLSLVEQITKSMPAVIYDNSGFYMLGVSIGLFALTYAALHEVILQLPLTKSVTKRITYTAFVGIGIMIILPQIVNYSIDDHLKNNGYKICEQVSSNWLMYKHIAYVSNAETCIELIFEREKRLSEPLF